MLKYVLVGLVLFLGSNSVMAESPRSELFDMDAIRDASTLDVKVIQDWHLVEGRFPTRQKQMTILVGEMWPGQPYRVAVSLVVPADGKANGFLLTGGNTPERLQEDAKIFALEQLLLSGGVGLVQTVVQEPRAMGLRELGTKSNDRFYRSLNAHDKVQYWAWPATMMRAITAAYSEKDHFGVGKVAMSGGSKNGATPSMAIIHDDRMTAVHASVSPIWDSPLRMCDTKAWEELKAEHGEFRHPFLGGHYGPIYNRHALEAGRSWEDLQKLARQISDDVFITRNIESLREREVDMLFHPGTHDFVAYDLSWGGEHHPTIPIYLRANSGHGKKSQHPAAENDQRNRDAFLLEHFFEDVEPLLTAPTVKHQVEGDSLNISVRFAPNSGEESGRIWWINNRALDGSPDYLKVDIPEENWAEMQYDQKRGVWQVTVPLDPEATRIDFFTNHRKIIRYQDQEYSTYLSSPYTRVILKK
jgi:hypothetical protein